MEKGRLTIVDVAFSMKNAKDEYGMKIADHKLICKVLDAHTKELKEDNALFRDKILEDVLQVIRTELRPIKESLSNIAGDIVDIKRTLQEHSIRISNEEAIIQDHEDRLRRKKQQIEKLCERVSLLEPDSIKEIKDMKPYLIRIANAFRWWKIVLYIAFIIGVFLAIHFIFLS